MWRVQIVCIVKQILITHFSFLEVCIFGSVNPVRPTGVKRENHNKFFKTAVNYLMLSNLVIIVTCLFLGMQV